MTLRETELLGKKLVRPLGFRRSTINHQDYYLAYKHIYINIKFSGQGNGWAVELKYSLNHGTEVVFRGTHLDLDNILSDADKLIAVFKFIRG
jgi:hypothetical protein